jgi:hypothetical protein
MSDFLQNRIDEEDYDVPHPIVFAVPTPFCAQAPPPPFSTVCVCVCVSTCKV